MPLPNPLLINTIAMEVGLKVLFGLQVHPEELFLASDKIQFLKKRMEFELGILIETGERGTEMVSDRETILKRAYSLLTAAGYTADSPA